MLFDPERKTWIDMETRVNTGNPRIASKRCEAEAERQRQQGEVIELKGVKPSRTGRTHTCIFEREIQEDDES